MDEYCLVEPDVCLQPAEVQLLLRYVLVQAHPPELLEGQCIIMVSPIMNGAIQGMLETEEFSPTPRIYHIKLYDDVSK